MKKIIVLLLLTFVTILPTFATYWVQTGKKSYMDVDSIESCTVNRLTVSAQEFLSGKNILYQHTYWTKHLNDGSSSFKNLERLLNKKIWYCIAKNIIDLDKKCIATKEVIFYDQMEHPISRTTYNDYELSYSSIVPNTVSEFEYTIVSYVLESGKDFVIEVFKSIK